MSKRVMAVHALAGEIVQALLADEIDGGYDLTGGLFGPAFSKLVRRWALAESLLQEAGTPVDPDICPKCCSNFPGCGGELELVAGCRFHSFQAPRIEVADIEGTQP